ncbi:uncharacterized protein LOC130447053 [Diorhabda sublineata]|uniref:uncharacterized protein LOC130447053 n=1 Tax=Diorhabda sublineata TaxID=1163346 RepID=UPI0024E0CBE4|nr:uncharacterized protein LOC130447053 [Diorhabda sublineata]
MDLKQLETIFDKNLGKNKKIVDIKSSNLVEKGENNGGELFKLDITVKNEETKEDTVLHVVGKTIPLIEKFQEIFNIQVTFKAEILFYDKIVPILQRFQKENGMKNVITCFPKFYGGRLNLNGSNTVDKDGIMIMENLKMSGYTNLDRHVGYNLKESMLLLKDLAEFHSTVIAFKLKHPDLFFKEIRPVCNNHLQLTEENSFKDVIGIVEEILLQSKECTPYVPKIRKMWNEFKPDFSGENKREPFATITHSDLWVNNAMMKYVNGEPVKNKFVDFQLYNYGSPGFDILNFLFTSVQTNVLRMKFDDLIRFYHNEFVNNIKRLNCEYSKFSYSKFLKELELDSVQVLNWDLSFIPMVVFGQKGHALPDSNVVDFNDAQFKAMMVNNIPEEAKRRLHFMIEEYINRKWL